MIIAFTATSAKLLSFSEGPHEGLLAVPSSGATSAKHPDGFRGGFSYLFLQSPQAGQCPRNTIGFSSSIYLSNGGKVNHDGKYCVVFSSKYTKMYLYGYVSVFETFFVNSSNLMITWLYLVIQFACR